MRATPVIGSVDCPAADAAAPSLAGWQRDWRPFAAMMLCAVVSLLVRWTFADHPLTMDELWHLAISAGRGNDYALWPSNELLMEPTSLTSLASASPVGSLWAPVTSVLHPPLYTFSLRLWREAFGDGDWAAAMYSAVWSIAAILLVFDAVRRQSGVGLATCCGLAMALSPLQSHLGTEIREYGMLMGLAAMVVWQMVRIESSGATTGRVWMLGLTLCPLMLTHYFAAGCCAAVAIWGMVRLRGRIRRQFMASISVAAACFIVLWLPQAVSQIEDMGAGDGYVKTEEPFWKSSLLSGIAMPMRLLVYVASRKPAAAASVALIAVTVAGTWRRPALLPWLLMLTVPIGSLVVLDVIRGTHHTWYIRYAAAAAVAVPAAPVLAASALRPTAGWMLGLASVALAAAMFGATRDIGSPAFHHMTTAFLPEIEKAADHMPLAVLVPPDSGNRHYGGTMVLEWSHVPGFFPRPIMLLDEPQPTDILRLRDAAPGGRFWLVTSGQPSDGDAEPDWLRNLLPEVRLVRAPLLVPFGGHGTQPQPPVELWLLEFESREQVAR